MRMLNLFPMLLVALSPIACAQAEQTRPNVLFIFIDDMGYGDFSCYGNEDVSTPHCDRLTEQGARFTQFYVASPICSPSRVACTTGQFPARWRITSFINSRKSNHKRGMADYLDPKAPAIARTFRQAGYATAHFGKWHMGGGRDVGEAPLPSAYGFDEHLVGFEGLGDRALIRNHGLSNQSAKLKKGKITWHEKHELTGLYVDRTIDFIERSRRGGKPFYVHLWFNDVHDPFHPTEADRARFEGKARDAMQRDYFAVLTAMDRQIGRLMQKLDELGVTDNTLVVLSSDNGPTDWMRYYNSGITPPGKTAGLRGRKWSLHEGGIREPLIVRFPGRIKAGAVDETSVMCTIDFFPTFCSLAGVPLPDGVAFDGEDVSDIWRGKPRVRSKSLIWEYGSIHSPLRGHPDQHSPSLAIRDGKWKLLINTDGSDAQLYDLDTDPGETRNVIGDHPAVTSRLKSRLLDWQQDVFRDRS